MPINNKERPFDRNFVGEIVGLNDEEKQIVKQQLNLDAKADLVSGKVPESELPSYVDDVIEGYYYDSKFYADAEHTTEIEGEQGKIYADLSTGSTYRWSGSQFVQIGGQDLSSFIQFIEVSDITALTDEQCTALKPGDVVVKLTSTQKHTYVVSYKEAEVGMCLTYTDASTAETVSYDYTDGHWVYNSTDITHLNEKELPATLGTAGQVLTVNDGATGVEWANPSGGGSLYLHRVQILVSSMEIVEFDLINTSSTAFTSTTLKAFLENTGHTSAITGFRIDGSYIDVESSKITHYYNFRIFVQSNNITLNVVKQRFDMTINNTNVDVSIGTSGQTTLGCQFGADEVIQIM